MQIGNKGNMYMKAKEQNQNSENNENENTSVLLDSDPRGLVSPTSTSRNKLYNFSENYQLSFLT
ncbi:hypothetical protein C0J52_25746 [Blattella germanica]|nr:hypothetical protein C0J52_25746 [Blattella germanica]